jgi:single-strand DNA-binding protein
MRQKLAVIPNLKYLFQTPHQVCVMKGLNKVTLIGHLGSKPEVKVIREELKVLHIAIATTEIHRNRDGQMKTHTDWHNLVLWDKLAGVAEKYLTKGSLVYIEGKLKTRHYEDRNGHRKYVSEVIVDEIIMLK